MMRYDDAFSNLYIADIFPDARDRADDLMTQNLWLRVGGMAELEKVGVAESAKMQPEKDLFRLQPR
jgi:hypothetical protein